MNQKLKFCPNCGRESLNWEEDRKWSCRDCGFVLYNNVAAAVAVVIRCGDEVFLTRRNQDPKKGKLDLSGGFTDPKESAEETCERELFEELKLRINTNELKYLASLPNIYHYKGIDYNTLDLFYEYYVEEKFLIELEISEISEGLWVPISEIDVNEIAFDSQKKFFTEYR